MRMVTRRAKPIATTAQTPARLAASPNAGPSLDALIADYKASLDRAFATFLAGVKAEAPAIRAARK